MHTEITSPGRRSSHRAFWALVLAALGLRLVYVLAWLRAEGAVQFSDFLYMHQIGASLANGEGFCLSGERIFNQSFGYPALLAPFYYLGGAKVGVALVLNAVLGAVAVGLTYCLALRLFTSASEAVRHRRALWTALMALVYPDSLMFAGLAASENLLVPLLLLLALVVLLPWKREWVAGVLAGGVAALAASAKANVVLWFPAIPVLWWFMRRRVVGRTLWAALAGALVLLPWTVANYRASGGYFIPFSAISGAVLLDSTNPEARGYATNKYSLSPEEEEGCHPVELDRKRGRKAMEYIRQDPVWYAKLCARKFVCSLSPARDWAFEYGGMTRLFVPLVSRWVPTAFNAMLLACYALGLWVLRREGLGLVFGLSAFIAASALQVMFCAYTRYRFPFLFLGLPIVAVGLDSLLQAGRGIVRMSGGQGKR